MNTQSPAATDLALELILAKVRIAELESALRDVLAACASYTDHPRISTMAKVPCAQIGTIARAALAGDGAK